MKKAGECSHESVVVTFITETEINIYPNGHYEKGGRVLLDTVVFRCLDCKNVFKVGPEGGIPKKFRGVYEHAWRVFSEKIL